MEDQQVRLHIQAIHTIEDQELLSKGLVKDTEKIENWYNATLRVKENATYIQYNETELEQEDVKTVIKVEGQEVTILKFGDVKSTQKFAKGKQYKTNYETPYGMLPLEVDTKEIVVDFISKNDGFIQIDYVLDVAGERLGTRKVDIRVVPETHKHVVYKH